MNASDSDLLERWIEEQTLAFLANSSAGRRSSPEEFVSALETPNVGAKLARARLLDRLQTLAAFEREFRAAREDPIGPGADLADFEVFELVGRGGMGRVFRARQKSLGREVAIKVPMWPMALDPQSRIRFLREAQAVAQLQHPGIVPLYQVGEHEGSPFLVMEFVRARSLAAILLDVKEGRSPRAGAALRRPGESYEQAAAELVIAILEALQAAHEASVVHRDVKPGNILIEANGRARVLDFGLASLRGEDSLTATHDVVGTPNYIAPETLRDARAAGPWSDAYAAGVVLYEILALERPFESDTPAQTLAKIEAGEPTPLHAHRRIPKRLSAIVEHAMTRELERRYVSAQAFAADLRAYLDGREIQARPTSVPTRVGRRLRRHPAVTAVSVLLIVSLAILGAVWNSERTARRSADAVTAQVDHAGAVALTREAFLWEFADGEPGGARARQSAGRTRAIELLEDAVKKDRHVIEARLELARLYVASGNRQAEALDLLTALEAEGARQRVIRWTRAWALDPTRKGVNPDPEETVVEDGLEPIDRLAWARSLLNRYQADQSTMLLRPLEQHPILGAVARYLQFETCNTRGKRDQVRGRAYLQSATEVVPDHPIVIANLARMLCELENVQGDVKETDPAYFAFVNRRADMAALIPAFERAEDRYPQMRALWTNHLVLLQTLNRSEELQTVVERALVADPDHSVLLMQWAQMKFGLWSQLPGFPQAIPAEELELVRSRIERLVDLGLAQPLSIYQLSKVYYWRGDRAKPRDWAQRARDEALPRLDEATRASIGPELDELLDWSSDKPPAKSE